MTTLFLSLPLELLQRITGMLDVGETIPSVRRTCKSLDAATFDQFASASFTQLYCCVFLKSHWKRLLDLLRNATPRVATRVRGVCFMNCLLKNKYVRSTGEDMQLAPNREQDVADARYDAHQTHAKTKAARIKKMPPNSLMIGVLLELKRHFPRIQVQVSVWKNRRPDFKHLPAHRSMLMAIASTQLRVRQLVISYACTHNTADIFSYMRSAMLDCAYLLLEFILRGTKYAKSEGSESSGQDSLEWKRVGAIECLLKPTRRLHHLELNLAGFDGLKDSCEIATRLLQATPSCNLTTLILEHTFLDENVLVNALTRWTSTLENKQFCGFKLTDTNKGWPRIYQLISSLPNLRPLILSDLEFDPDFEFQHNFVISFEHVQRGEIWPDGLERISRMYEGREEVALGLEELMEKPLTCFW